MRIRPELSVVDDCDPSPSVSLQITSNEADNGLGDGDTSNDIVIHAVDDIELRAERSGKGDGRTYTLTWTATDASGNASTLVKEVIVPKSKGKKK